MKIIISNLINASQPDRQTVTVPGVTTESELNQIADIFNHSNVFYNNVIIPGFSEEETRTFCTFFRNQESNLINDARYVRFCKSVRRLITLLQSDDLSDQDTVRYILANAQFYADNILTNNADPMGIVFHAFYHSFSINDYDVTSFGEELYKTFASCNDLENFLQKTLSLIELLKHATIQIASLFINNGDVVSQLLLNNSVHDLLNLAHGGQLGIVIEHFRMNNMTDNLSTRPSLGSN